MFACKYIYNSIIAMANIAITLRPVNEVSCLDVHWHIVHSPLSLLTISKLPILKH